MKKLVYRKALADDVTLLAKLYLDFSVKSHKDSTIPLMETGLEDYISMAESTLLNNLVTTYIVLDGETPVGFADWYEIELIETLFLDDVFVKDDYAGQGIGSHLIEIFEECAKKKNFTMKLEVYSWNKHAYELYKRRGYTEDGIVMVKKQD